MLVSKNDRRATRHHVRIDCEVVRENDFRLVGHRTLDLSAEGMLVRTATDVCVGERVFVTFQATTLGLWFDTEAEITRLIRGRRPEDEGRAFGLRFVDMPSVSRLILRGHLRRVPPPLPQRPRRVDYAATIRQIAAA
ncbi:MAG TPA: PilZ domain-containing protein [Polyangiaceae bacterium]|jgi:c-di-GMP-binding flagellar brake protein YcgR